MGVLPIVAFVVGICLKREVGCAFFKALGICNGRKDSYVSNLEGKVVKRIVKSWKKLPGELKLEDKSLGPVSY